MASHQPDKLALCMAELGCGCSSDEDTFRSIVRQCPFVTEQSVAEVLGLIARTQSSIAASDKMLGFSDPASSWNYAVIVDVLKQAKPDLDWALVADLFDHPDFVVPDAAGFELLSAAFRRGTGGQQIPIKALTGRQWNNLQVHGENHVHDMHGAGSCCMAHYLGDMAHLSSFMRMPPPLRFPLTLGAIHRHASIAMQRSHFMLMLVTSLSLSPLTRANCPCFSTPPRHRLRSSPLSSRPTAGSPRSMVSSGPRHRGGRGEAEAIAAPRASGRPTTHGSAVSCSMCCAA